MKFIKVRTRRESLVAVDSIKELYVIEDTTFMIIFKTKETLKCQIIGKNGSPFKDVSSVLKFLCEV